jgi:hypothetical protein
MTGRGAGYCGGFAMPGYANEMGGAGHFGRGRGGGGRGWRHMFYATGLPQWARPPWGAAAMPYGPAPTRSHEQELEWLKQQAQQAAETLEQLRQRIGELESKAAE